MNSLYALASSIRILLFVLAVIFAYYSIYRVRVMKGSRGSQIMADSAIIAVIASASGVMDIFLPANSTTTLFTFFLWVTTVIIYIVGSLIYMKPLRKIYNTSMMRIILKNSTMLTETIGTLSLVFLGIPVYIWCIMSVKPNEFSLIVVLNTIIWIFGLSNLIIVARKNYLFSAKPDGQEDKIIMLEDDILTASVYSDLLNRFISMIGFPIAGLIEETLNKYFDHNPVLFEGCSINRDETIDFSPALRNVSRINVENRVQNICIIFSTFSSILLELYSTVTSREHVEKVLAESYKYIQGIFRPSSLFYDILRSLPEGVLEEEKITLLPRGELETRVRERTRELEESRKYINNVIKSMNDMLIVINPDGKIKTINKAVERTLGYNEEELVEQSVSIIFKDKDSIPLQQALCDGSTITNLSQNVENTLISKDGKSITVFLSSSVLYDEYDKIQGIVFLAHDITERKLIEDALKTSEEKYRRVVDNASEAIFVAQNGFLKFANIRATQISGYSEEELTSKPFIEFIFQEDRQMVAERHQRRLQGEDIPNSYVTRIINKQMEVKWVELNIVPIVWEGNPATLNFMEDITDKRKMEEDLLRVQKLESIGLLAGGIAHDFNNILTGIMGNVSLAKMQVNSGEKAFERLTVAESACLQAKKLTQQLLTFSKGGVPIIKPTLIKELLIESSNFVLRGTNTKCEFSIPDTIWNAEVDAGQIGQVISNLIINADQAMPEGGIINVRAENVILEEKNTLILKSGEYIKIIIEDRGIGIPEENLKRIFDPYFTTKQKGNGLGLAIVHSIVRKHNGQIIVESQLGIGTMFQIYLPAFLADIQIKKEEKEESKDKIIFGKGKILVMDDEETIRQLAYEMLNGMGYEVISAIDGFEAMDLYIDALKSKSPFDVVIMDLTIPGGLGGKETLRKIAKIDPGVKAIVSSGYSDDPVMSDFQKYGFKDFIAKPYKTSELSEVVHRVIT
jgi:PAS domain S-box-containing protein